MWQVDERIVDTDSSTMWKTSMSLYAWTAHESLAITYKTGRKSCLIHIPRHLRTQAQEAIEDYHKLKNLIEQISELNVKTFKDLARQQRTTKKSQSNSSTPLALSGEGQ